MPAEFIYTTYKLARHYPPDRTVLEDISISFYPGAKIGVIGPNGAGKSSLLRIMAGLDDGFNGEARLTPGFTVGYLSQEPQLDPTKDVKGNVLDGVREVHGLIEHYNAVMAKWSEPDADYEAIGAEQSALEDRINAVGAWDLERNVEIAMDALRCPPDDADVTTLSGGEKRRVALCRLLLQHPDLLLLDEPTNHLDAESVDWLERFLHEYSGTVVADHPRPLLPGQRREVDPRARSRSGHSVLRQLLQLAGAEAGAHVPGAEAGRTPSSGRWPASSNGCACRRRPDRPRARLDSRAYEQLLAEAQDATRRRHARAGDRHPARAAAGRAGHRGQGPSQGLWRPAAHRGPDVLAAAGRASSGSSAPTARARRRCSGCSSARRRRTPARSRSATPSQLSYVDQSRDTLQADKTVFEEITQGAEIIKVGSRELPARAYVSSFNFRGTDQQKLVGALSGGERNRVHLAKLLQSGGNVLLLDEPTNDLDVDTLRALEAGLESFPGCVVVISHDRWFLDRIATHILAFEGDSQVRLFQGNVSDYEAFRHKELGTAADQPHRIRYKKLAAA